MAIDICASFVSVIQNVHRVFVFMFYTEDRFMFWFGPSPSQFSKDTDINEFYFRQWEKCIVQRKDFRYFTKKELLSIAEYCVQLRGYKQISDSVWQLCLSALTTHYIPMSSFWVCIMPKFQVVHPETYTISMDLWNFIFQVAVQRNSLTDTIEVPIPPCVVKHWITYYPTDYFGCRVFGNQRYVNLPDNTDDPDARKWFKIIFQTVNWNTDDIQPLYDIILKTCNSTQPRYPESIPIELFSLNELTSVASKLRPTSQVLAWKTVHKMCLLTTIHTVCDYPEFANMLAQAMDCMDQEWFMYASSILLKLRKRTTQPPAGLSKEQYIAISKLHADLYTKEFW